MAINVQFSPVDICAGNNHAHMNINVNAGQFVFNGVLLIRSTVMDPITVADVENLVNTLARIHCLGMAPAAVRTAITTGWTSSV